MGKPFPKSYPLSQQIREKASVTAHLPKGHLARLQKKSLFGAKLGRLTVFL